MSDATLGAMLTVMGLGVVLGLIAGAVWWRRKLNQYPEATDPEALREQWRAEYREKVQAKDPETLETSRDFYDNFGGSWKMDVGFSLYFVILFGSLLVLIPLFVGLKALTD